MTEGLKLFPKRTFILGEGPVGAKVLFVGESPGPPDAASGLPFQGPVGDMLNRMITAIGLERENCYLTNVVKFISRGKELNPEILSFFVPYLYREIEAINPEIIITLGATPTQVLLETEIPISKVRGEFHNYRGIRVLPTFNPAYLLRDPTKKREVWEDMQKVRAALAEKPEEDLIVLIDENDAPLGTAPKLAAHHANTPLHRGFSIFLFNKKGELLLQRRAMTKKTWPGAWSNSCCGHPMLGESNEDAAKRRVNYELGITGIDPVIVLSDFRYRAEKDSVVENEICPVLVAFTEREPVINPDEVNEIKWVDWDEFVGTADQPDSPFSPWAIEEAALLASNERFNEYFRTHTGRQLPK